MWRARHKRRHPCIKSGEWIAVEWCMHVSYYSLLIQFSLHLHVMIHCECVCVVCVRVNCECVCVCAAQYYIKSLRSRARFSNIFLVFSTSSSSSFRSLFFVGYLCTLYVVYVSKAKMKTFAVNVLRVWLYHTYTLRL